MVQRFAKKPISEGYDLWDCGYLFGALRLFLFKSESAPPFQMGPCIDAMAEISLEMGSDDDAKDTFAIAADKYKLIQQPILAELMRTKLACMMNGPTAAKEHLEAFLKEADPEKNGGGAKADMKTRSALARSYAYLAELLLDSASAEDKQNGEDNSQPSAEMVEVAPRAAEAAQLAVNLGWDRVHTGYLVLGECYEVMQELEKAKEAYGQAVQHCPRYLQALDRLVDVMKSLGAPRKDVLTILDQAIDAHPHADHLREKAFLLSEAESDEAALNFINSALENPPVEEMESTASPATVAMLLKAKAAILADGGKLAEALAAAQEAVKVCPQDEEAAIISADISNTLSA